MTMRVRLSDEVCCFSASIRTRCGFVFGRPACLPSPGQEMMLRGGGDEGNMKMESGRERGGLVGCRLGGCGPDSVVGYR